MRYFDGLRLANSILIDFAQVIYRYISNGTLKLKVVEGEVRSSTMSKKVNLIDFENSEVNLDVEKSAVRYGTYRSEGGKLTAKLDAH